MEEQALIQKKLTRQLRWLNINLTIFGLLGVVGTIIIALLLMQAIQYVKDAGTKVQSLQQSTSNQLDLKKDLCQGSDSVSMYLKTTSKVCQ